MSTRRRRRILFVHNYATRFVQLDIDMLRERHSITELEIRSPRVNPLAIRQQVARHDLVFGWFASWHTLLPFLFARRLRTPSLLVVGGYDLANLPEAGYGHQRGGLKTWISRATMRLAGALMTNATYSQREAEANAGIPAHRVHVVYHGLPDPFGALPEKNGRPLVLTVGNVWRENLWRKGLEPFVRAAAHLPDVPFVLAGAWRDGSIAQLKAMATANVTFTGWLEDEALLDTYRRAHVYVQASAHEGFGMSVAEAMLAGCIPVVTRRGALPEVVGGHGEQVESQDPAAIAAAIGVALAYGAQCRMRVRQHVLTNFTLGRRRLAMESLITSLLEG